ADRAVPTPAAELLRVVRRSRAERLAGVVLHLLAVFGQLARVPGGGIGLPRRQVETEEPLRRPLIEDLDIPDVLARRTFLVRHRRVPEEAVGARHDVTEVLFGRHGTARQPGRWPQ